MKSNEERVKSILKKVSDYKMKKRREGYSLVTCICAVAVAVIVGINVPTVTKREDKKDLHIFQTDEKELAFNSKKEIELTTFKTKEELIEKMKSGKKANEKYWVYEYDMGIMNGVVALPESTQSTGNLRGDYESVDSTLSHKEMQNDEFSTTNTQVQGVDESDIVKTNGDYIYYLSGNTLRIFENKNNDLKLIKEINYNNEKNKEEYTNTYAHELYLTNDYIVVIATGNIFYPISYNEVNMISVDRAYMKRYNTGSTKILIYDINNYELLREIETEGNYLSSRKVDDDIYLISNKYMYMSSFDENYILPLYKDTVVNSGDVNEVSISSVKCFPRFEEEMECTYMIITSFSLDELDEKANVETYIGTGSEIYCSKDNLYVTKSKRDYSNKEQEAKTQIHKFAIYNGKVKYVAEGEVEGTLLNQFSMDEYDGNFRITTTKGYTWDDSSENNLYILDDNLKLIGKLEGLAKGEKIYSTRFMGDKCYIVTYKTVDPLFVLDLSNPENPKVLGELKIPGYSSYLHPLGDNYLIGFGEDSIEKIHKNYDGTEQVTAYSTGLKLAIFDITDLNNPKELDSVKIGGRGSSSELLHNHKSLLFKEDEGLFAFPAYLYSQNAGYYENGVPKYGKLEFSGALVFDLSIENGIKLRGKISNVNGNENDLYDNSIERIIYIGDKLYTLSRNMIKVSDIKTVEEINKVEF